MFGENLPLAIWTSRPLTDSGRSHLYFIKDMSGIRTEFYFAKTADKKPAEQELAISDWARSLPVGYPTHLDKSEYSRNQRNWVLQNFFIKVHMIGEEIIDATKNRADDHNVLTWTIISDFKVGYNANIVLHRIKELYKDQLSLVVKTILERQLLVCDCLSAYQKTYDDAKLSQIIFGPDGEIWLCDYESIRNISDERRSFTSKFLPTNENIAPLEYGQLDARIGIYTLLKDIDERFGTDLRELEGNGNGSYDEFHATIMNCFFKDIPRPDALLKSAYFQDLKKYESVDRFQTAIAECVESQFCEDREITREYLHELAKKD